MHLIASYFLCQNLNQHKDVNVFNLYCHVAHSCGSGVVFTSNYFAASTIMCFWCLDAVPSYYEYLWLDYVSVYLFSIIS